MTSALSCPCPLPVANVPRTPEPLLTTRGANAEWRVLEAAIDKAFKESDNLSSEHRCAELLRTTNAARLYQELRGKGDWIDGCYTRTTLSEGDGYIAMLLCWSPGVESPVHAHSDAAAR